MTSVIGASTERAWREAPRRLRAIDGVLHVWRAELASRGEGLEQLLGARERERASRMRDVHRRELWIRSRGILRTLLARYLDADPLELRFALGAHGKPALEIVRGDDRGDIRFNLSHSGTLALYAVSAGREVGIDVEVMRRRIGELGIAERVLGAERARLLARLEGEARTRAFLEAWVAHEAAVKCLGVGLAVPGPGTGGLAATGPGTGGLAATGPGTGGLAAMGAGAFADGPSTTALELGHRAAAAVAIESARSELHCYSWEG